MMQLCPSYHGLAVFVHKKAAHLQWLNMIAAYIDSRFKFGLQVRYPDKFLIILPRTFQINDDRTKRTSLMLSIMLCLVTIYTDTNCSL